MIARIGLIAALEEEADAFAPDQAGQVERLGEHDVRLVEIAGRMVAVNRCGVGKVNAASAATLIHSRYNVDLLMIIGAAGRLSGIVGDCFVIRDAVQGDYGARRAGGFVHFTAGAWPIGPADIAAICAHPLPDIGLPGARIVTTDSFVECVDFAAGLRDGLGGDLIDMETAALAQTAVRLSVPWAAIKAPSDDADAHSAGDFTANLRRAARLAAEAAERAIAHL